MGVSHEECWSENERPTSRAGQAFVCRSSFEDAIGGQHQPGEVRGHRDQVDVEKVHQIEAAERDHQSSEPGRRARHAKPVEQEHAACQCEDVVRGDVQVERRDER